MKEQKKEERREKGRDYETAIGKEGKREGEKGRGGKKMKRK